MKTLLFLILIISFQLAFGQKTSETENQLFLNNSKVITGTIYRFDSTFIFKDSSTYYYVTLSDIKYAPSVKNIHNYGGYDQAMYEAWRHKSIATNLQWIALGTGLLTGIFSISSDSAVPGIIGGIATLGFSLGALIENSKGNSIGKNASLIRTAKPYFPK